MDRVCIFIDGSNLYYQLKELDAKVKIDYHQFSLALTGADRKLIRAYYYICPPINPQQDSYNDQQKFLLYLSNTPYMQVQYGNLEIRGETQVEKGIDVRIAIDMVSLAYTNAYDAAVLVSNDADWIPAVAKVKDLGKHVEYAYLSRKTAQLVDACDRIVQIDKQILQSGKAKR
jgi:uncharacterized LabA/DUF88 family protein